MGLPEAYKKLKEYRERTDLKLKNPKHLKSTFTDFDGLEKPLTVRYYQVQGILHLVVMKRFVLGDDTGLGKCKPLNSLVLTDAGLLRLGALSPTTGPMTPNTFYQLHPSLKVWTGWRWATIKKFYYCGIKPTKKVRTRRGYETEGSFVHPLWIRRAEGESWVQMRYAKAGDNLCIVRAPVPFPETEPVLPCPDLSTFTANTRVYTTPDRLDPRLAALLGYIVAEGWTNHRQCFYISQDKTLNPEVYCHARSLCRDLFGWEEPSGSMTSEDGFFVHSTHLRAYLKGLGVEMGVSDSKTVPWPVFQGTRGSVINFLRAFFDGEGSVVGDVIEVSSASEKMLKEIQVLLLRLGILCSRSPKKVKGREHTYWRLALCGEDARSFHGVIGFITPRKQQALKRLLAKTSNANLDVVPHAQAEVEALREALLQKVSRTGANESRKGSGLKQYGVSFEKTLSNLRNGGRNPTFTFLKRLLDVAQREGLADSDAFQRVLSIYENHFFYDPIVSIEEEEQEVADIEVDDAAHAFTADGFINHNTLEAIAALCYLWEKEPSRKAVILTTKSATNQWVNEFSKFTVGIKVFTCRGSPGQRQQARAAFEKATGPSVIVMGYRSAVQDFRHIQGWAGHIYIFDEATAFKNPVTQVHQVCKHLAMNGDRVWGLTATLIKNHLMEGYGIYKVITPALFGMTKNQFMIYYCIIRMQRLPRSNRMIPIIVGYTPEKIQEFKEVIDPYFIGRPKHEVASELPTLTSQIIDVDLSPEQEDKYFEALSGILKLGDADDADVKEVSKLTAISYCQEIVDHLGLIGCEGASGKTDSLLELLTEGDFADEKVIVFTRFRKMVDILMPILAKAGIKAVRITGSENQDQREKAKADFQNPSGDVRVVCLTAAGSEAINLQAAKAVICYDTPWSAGDFLQLVGRMIRIGSTHDKCYVIHLVARGRKVTIDHRVMEVLGKKMHLVEAVLGKRIKGEGDSVMIKAENDISNLFSALRDDAKEAGKK